MIKSVNSKILKAFQGFVQGDTGSLMLKITSTSGEVAIPSFRVGSRRILLVQSDAGANLASLADQLKTRINWTEVAESDLQEVLVGVAGAEVRTEKQQIIQLGVRALPLHHAIAEIVGLPPGWLTGQQSIIQNILEPLRVGTCFQTARLRVPEEANYPEEDALVWLEKTLGAGEASGKLLYVRAEAGKGKSTTFATFANEHLQLNEGPLPLLIPLRTIPRGVGASWDAIASTIGVVGATTGDLARAIRSGLVILMLDGLDEVSGRYDPIVIQDIIRAVSTQVRGPNARLAFSGRTTEGMLIDSGIAYQRTIELPEISGVEFRKYCEQVIKTIEREWPNLANQVGEPISPNEHVSDRILAPAEYGHLLQWVLLNFIDFGKDRSLFFVQSLACLGREMQLRGNKPIFVNQSGSAPKVLLCNLYDACILAASLACLREQGKVAPEAQTMFTPARQLDVATWLAVLASVDDSVRAGFPTPNLLITQAFDIDPVNQTEELTAIVRQMQKHALLYAANGLVGGDWRPGFLSDWVRSALLVRAWINRTKLDARLAADVARGITIAQRARNAYESVFPDTIRTGNVSLADLVVALVKEANSESPEACGNFWFLMQGLPDDKRAEITVRPNRVAEWTDFSEAEFEGIDFGAEFSANLCTFVGTRFIGCSFTNCHFTQCDFTEAIFQSCTFAGVLFDHSDGPILFDDCDQIRDTIFREARSKLLPTWQFLDCQFQPKSKFEQINVPCNNTYGPIAGFDECTYEADLENLLVGPELGQDRTRFRGLAPSASESGNNADIDCLRQLLHPFFPSRAGSPGSHQARDYIRSSAIGRGRFPKGSPNHTELASFLTSEGFTNGGRQGHLYAPWSEVAGTTNAGLRSEFSAFLRNPTSRGPTINRMLEKIRKVTGW